MSAIERQILLDSPIGYWPLDETSGSTAKDRSGNGRDGTYQNAPSLAQSVAGFVCPSFNGTSQYVSIPDPGGIYCVHPFTAECWARTTSNGYRSAFAKNNQAANTEKWDLRIDNAHHATSYLDRSTGGTSAIATYTGAVIDDGLWHHLAFTWDASLTNRLYLDGVMVASVTASNTYIESSNTTALTIAAYDSSNTEFWSGYVAHAACYASVLSDAAIARHYQAGARRAVVV